MRIISAFIVTLLVAVNAINAQVTTATIEGRVKDAEGKPIPDATVIVRNPKEGINRTTFTSASGYFSIQGLQPGEYEVAVQHIGYQTQIKKAITLLLGQTATIAFALEQQAVQMGPVEVTAERAPTFEL
ncbi:MAG: carboxypeptidase-like regulatory domain-containing protein, partial [Candidatus Kryptoniota bacterium]